MSLDEDYDVIYKIIIIGDSGVGKSNILSRYLRDEFKQDSKSTVGVAFGAKKLTIKYTTMQGPTRGIVQPTRYHATASTPTPGAQAASYE